MKKRLQVFLAHSGVASRRKAAEVIEKGRVSVNGQTVLERGFAVDDACDKIAVDGIVIKPEHKIYILLNKPKRTVTTVKDEQGRGTVMDLLPQMNVRVYPVGRLDKDTEGVLILTNDGELANRLMHPSSGVKKIYTAEVKGSMADERIKRLEKGIMIEGEKTAPCKIHVLKRGQDNMALRIELHEGKKRQIRRMLAAMGTLVKRLRRISYGGITAKGVPLRGFRELTNTEVQQLKRLCGLGK